MSQTWQISCVGVWSWEECVRVWHVNLLAWLKYHGSVHFVLGCIFPHLVYMLHMARCAPPPPWLYWTRGRNMWKSIRAVLRRAESVLSKTGHRRGWGTERLRAQRGPTLYSAKTTQTTASRFVFPQLADMSLPVVLPGSCCPVTGASQLAEPPYRNRPRGLSASSRLVAGGSRPLLSLGFLQLLLGGSMVALSFGALSLSNSPPIRNSCPFWAGSSVSWLRAFLSCGTHGCVWLVLHHHYRSQQPLSRVLKSNQLCMQDETLSDLFVV